MISKKEVGTILKLARKKLNYSVDDSVAALQKENIAVAPKTIYSWETGNSMPGADTFITLCKIYKIRDILAEFYDEPIDINSESETTTIIKKYRQLDADGKERVDYVLNLEYQLAAERAEDKEERLG